MKKITILIILITTTVFCQNRYYQATPSTYQSNSMSDIMRMYQSYNSPQTQTVSCQALYEYIVDKGSQKASLPNYILDSSWLFKVTAYEYNYKTYVVAEIKESEYSYKTSSYIFCGIPNMNWRYFQYGDYGDSNSYGERFHKYIFDYKCDCE